MAQEKLEGDYIVKKPREITLGVVTIDLKEGDILSFNGEFFVSINEVISFCLHPKVFKELLDDGVIELISIKKT